jgi:phosphoadenosine phosphosulfate reductase
MNSVARFLGTERAGVCTVSDAYALAEDDSLPALKYHVSKEALVAHLNDIFGDLDPVQRIRELRRHVDGALVFTTSFGLEDQALTHLIVASGADIRFATLDTGRLFPETYSVWAETEARYGIAIQPFYPNAGDLETLIAEQGINGFYASVAARSACCATRKLVPLARALQGAAGWLTGLRADQSATRRGMAFASHDTEPDLVKANPLFDWSRERVAALVQAEGIPANPLHEQGFLSIGCAPCTRAVAPGEPERAGRWWWETEGSAECGPHLTPDGRLVRAKVAS